MAGDLALVGAAKAERIPIVLREESIMFQEMWMDRKRFVMLKTSLVSLCEIEVGSLLCVKEWRKSTGYSGRRIFSTVLGRYEADREHPTIVIIALGEPEINQVRTCRTCGCTEDDCRQCVEKIGQPCTWLTVDRCSACEGVENPE